ncbi:hypothetical protein BGZ73_003177 [Actinomortierella ambigua]|nr:hypothetical protein BGZ73_003177 [Actinomortierella ambigua]
MPILRSMPLVLGLRTPVLDLKLAETQGVQLGDYPNELFLSRTKALDQHLKQTYPSSLAYHLSLAFIVVLVLVTIAVLAALHSSNAQPWILLVIAVMILLFVVKMFFLSRLDKANHLLLEQLQQFNDQDMPVYGVLYRMRKSHEAPKAFLSRVLFRIHLNLPSWIVELTTIDHIDEYSFAPDLSPAGYDDQSGEGVEGGQTSPLDEEGYSGVGMPSNSQIHELPMYRPRAGGNSTFLAESSPPSYDEVVTITVPPAAAVDQSRPTA